MALKSVASLFIVFSLAYQAEAACFSPPPSTCGLPIATGQPMDLSAILAALGVPSFASPALAQFFALPAVTAPSPALPVAHSSPVSPTKTGTKLDVNIPLTLPADIPLNKFCSCQKYAIETSLVPCAPAPVASGTQVFASVPLRSAPLAPPPLVSASLAPAPLDPVHLPPAKIALSPEVLQSLLAGLGGLTRHSRTCSCF